MMSYVSERILRAQKKLLLVLVLVLKSPSTSQSSVSGNVPERILLCHRLSLFHGTQILIFNIFQLSTSNQSLELSITVGLNFLQFAFN